MRFLVSSSLRGRAITSGLSPVRMMEPDLAEDVFEAVGSRLVRFYEICSSFDSVGACFSNDDWGFKNQTMLGPDDMRKYVFPWHKRIVEAIHKNGKTAKGICSVDRVRYRVDAKMDDDGTWHMTLKDENDHGEATLRWVEENNRFEGILTLGGHDHRLFMWKVRPRAATENEGGDTAE